MNEDGEDRMKVITAYQPREFFFFCVFSTLFCAYKKGYPRNSIRDFFMPFLVVQKIHPKISRQSLNLHEPGIILLQRNSRVHLR